MKRLIALVASLAFAAASFAAVNINTATKDELDKLPGIGPVKAQAIIDYRTKNGPFKSLEDIQKVSGIGPETFKDMQGKISLSGPTKIDWDTSKKAEAPKANAGKKDTPKADAGKTAQPVAAAAGKDAPMKEAAKEVSKEDKAKADKAKKEEEKKAKAEEKAKKEAEK